MLLLVLILVLIAFGLLVVALLSGSVTWAWVSVGVSVLAAVVLLLDWLQRRNAVKAGAEPATRETDAPRAAGTRTDIESVTEVLPVIPRSGSAPVSAPPADAADRGDDARFDDARGDAAADAQQTVVMPIVQPPGSADRPSGATAASTGSSGNSSLSVTKSGADRSESTPPAREGGARPEKSEEGPAAEAPAPPDAQPTVVAAVPARTSELSVRKSGASESTGPGSAAAESPERGDGDRIPERAPDAATGTAPERPDAAEERPERAVEEPDEERSEVPGPPVDADRPAEPAPDDAAVPPAGPEGDPPEETRDPAAAALVAGLEDEVLVVDEQPRYHIEGCRYLAGKPLIPLPAREAVELGFTPCGWCSPDRALAERHPAAAH
ncbi:hypothetical protein [Pseudonocardia nigra]|uniref:hypothetical protein n=1 Tax=Pseudonocardia nigra TaxID=1921578 RepID=UPI001C6022CF|nr:hypothetical protein [Pseudonocardia nigra]